MFFGSASFLFVFLPAVFLVVALSARAGERVTTYVLTAGSIVFYISWNIAHLPILVGSILLNYMFALALAISAPNRAQRILAAGVVFNLALLSLFKFGPTPSQAAPSITDSLAFWALPLGISFFTFQQISFLLSVQRGQVEVPALRHYALFVSFFPHLIAGPLVQFGEVGPALRSVHQNILRNSDRPVAFALIAIGLFKKLVIADGIATYVEPVYAAAQKIDLISASAAWAATFGFSLQVYFDFSGYCDIAIGVALLFGVRFPLNFNSPLKSENIAELWRRWNITISSFFHTTIYSPLSRGKRDHWRQYLALVVTMVVCGLWHGIGWGFVLFGLINGLALVMHRIWRRHTAALNPVSGPSSVWPGRVATTLLFTFSVVFFRADSPEAAIHLLKSLFAEPGSGRDMLSLVVTALLLLWVWCLPSSNELVGYRPSEPSAEPLIGPYMVSTLLGLACGSVLLLLWSKPIKPTFIYFAY